MKNWDNVQPSPNPKPVRVVRVQVVEQSGESKSYSYGFVHFPVAGKLSKIKMAEIGQPGA